MKKLLFFISIFLLLFSTTKSQSNYALIGKAGRGLSCVWKISVIDEFNNSSLSNAKVELYDKEYKIFSIRTNQEGVAIVIIYETTEIENKPLLKINDEKYSYTLWEKEISKYDYCYERGRGKMLVLGDSNDRTIDWSDGDNLPSSTKIAEDINSGKYRIFEGKTGWKYTAGGPELFEFNVLLKYNPNPKDKIYIGGLREDKSSIEEFPRESGAPNGWRELPIDKSGNILNVYVKGNIQLMIAEPEHEEFTVTKSQEGTTFLYCIDEAGNKTEYKAYSKSEAIRIANNYMRNH